MSSGTCIGIPVSIGVKLEWIEWVRGINGVKTCISSKFHGLGDCLRRIRGARCYRGRWGRRRHLLSCLKVSRSLLRLPRAFWTIFLSIPGLRLLEMQTFVETVRFVLTIEAGGTRVTLAVVGAHQLG